MCCLRPGHKYCRSFGWLWNGETDSVHETQTIIGGQKGTAMHQFAWLFGEVLATFFLHSPHVNQTALLNGVSYNTLFIHSVSFVCLFADGKVYAMGGMGVDTTPQALVRVYEAEKDQWQPLTSMPTPRYGATPFIRGNKIYLMGKNQICLVLYV